MAVSHDVFMSVHVCVCFLLKDTWDNLKKFYEFIWSKVNFSQVTQKQGCLGTLLWQELEETLLQRKGKEITDWL